MKKIFSIVLLISILLLSGCSSKENTDWIYFNNKYYDLESQDNNSKLYRAEDDSTIEIVLSESSRNKFKMIVSKQEYYEIEKDRNAIKVKFPNGDEATVHESGISANANMELTAKTDKILKDIYTTFSTSNNKNRNEDSISIFWVPFLIIAGLINIIAPQLSFHLSKGWMFKSAEPSELYLGVTRLIGIGLIIFSVIIIITSF
ncbi:DUF6199 family natural product biosynthesis protein [Sporosalibacterium faouarense]|uniref:DUF6199 family natural product biosynthesis protein n=1 Tax=Sporosalibacterium faouarense TaxID=516123 RepID=UPI001A9C43FA|nr:DUF6199 family natural product biosynthesis protein [Sporosalibacterium faouarense]